MVICKECKKHRKHHAKGLCELCYAMVRSENNKNKKYFELI